MLNYTNLIQEVLGILRQFKPDPKVTLLSDKLRKINPIKIIKKKIETLIEKEFLERDKEDTTILKYLA